MRGIPCPTISHSGRPPLETGAIARLLRGGVPAVVSQRSGSPAEVTTGPLANAPACCSGLISREASLVCFEHGQALIPEQRLGFAPVFPDLAEDLGWLLLAHERSVELWLPEVSLELEQNTTP